MDNLVPVICIDGPAGSGKGTVALRLAEELGWHYLDSGALYRALGVSAKRAGIPLDSARLLVSWIEALKLETRLSPPGRYLVWVNGEDLTDEIRSEESGAAASRVASIPEVRDALLARQRVMAQPPGLVAEGRDMGTVVFPQAVLKIYLTASSEKRAERRYNQLKEKGVDVTLRALLADLSERDRRDRNRPVSPLRPASDAIVVDSTGVDVEGVLDRVRALIGERLKVPPG